MAVADAELAEPQQVTECWACGVLISVPEVDGSPALIFRVRPMHWQLPGGCSHAHIRDNACMQLSSQPHMPSPGVPCSPCMQLGGTLLHACSLAAVHATAAPLLRAAAAHPLFKSFALSLNH